MSVRIAIVDAERCNPSKCNKECKRACPVNATGRLCVTVEPMLLPASDKKREIARIDESACVGCGICVSKCPFSAIQIINIPTGVSDSVVHRFLPNGFSLSNLPTPRMGAVLGLVGRNGVGKSTALKILSGHLRPNLGVAKTTEAEIFARFRGTLLQDYMRAVVSKEMSVSSKPQFVDTIPRILGAEKRVSAILEERRITISPETIAVLEIGHLLEREFGVLSGGELQRVALAMSLSRDAKLHVIDEPSSYLDVRQRIRMAGLIATSSEEKYMIVVEHDLSTLDYMADKISVLYGAPSAYGVATPDQGAAEGINTFISGYDSVGNVRFRPYPLKFTLHDDDEDVARGVVISYPSLEKRMGDFSLRIEAGDFSSSQITVLLGSNGSGKTTFTRMLAGLLAPDSGSVSSISSVSYKPQKISPSFEGTVRMLLSSKIASSMGDEFFKSTVLTPLHIEAIADLQVKSLSGGELQRVALALVLGKKASLYLIDEPSAYLDAEQRLETTKMLRRFAYTRRVAMFVVEHDLMMATALADRVILFDGTPGVSSVASSPQPLLSGMNGFLASLGVTTRRDAESGRIRINKKDSVLDREQRAKGQYFLV